VKDAILCDMVWESVAAPEDVPMGAFSFVALSEMEILWSPAVEISS